MLQIIIPLLTLIAGGYVLLAWVEYCKRAWAIKKYTTIYEKYFENTDYLSKLLARGLHDDFVTTSLYFAKQCIDMSIPNSRRNYISRTAHRQYCDRPDTADLYTLFGTEL